LAIALRGVWLAQNGGGLMSGRPRDPEPRVLVTCECGAVWAGRFAVNNPVIGFHRERRGRGCDVREFTDDAAEREWARLHGDTRARPRWIPIKDWRRVPKSSPET